MYAAHVIHEPRGRTACQPSHPEEDRGKKRNLYHKYIHIFNSSYSAVPVSIFRSPKSGRRCILILIFKLHHKVTLEALYLASQPLSGLALIRHTNAAEPLPATVQPQFSALYVNSNHLIHTLSILFKIWGAIIIFSFPRHNQETPPHLSSKCART